MILSACSGSPPPISTQINKAPERHSPSPIEIPELEPLERSSFEQRLLELEKSISLEGRRVLATGRQMVEEGIIVQGSCWGFINAVYNRAGFPPKRRRTLFKGRKKGPYAGVAQIQAGDWLYYINHSWGGSPHSGIFVEWIDLKEKSALILSYGGGSRQAPGRYREYDLSGIYRIIRPQQMPR